MKLDRTGRNLTAASLGMIAVILGAWVGTKLGAFFGFIAGGAILGATVYAIAKRKF